jgi:hypothetical protein
MIKLSQVRSFRFTLIADTGDRFSDFSPYVVSVNNDGTVAFQAALRQGGTGGFTGDGGPIATVADTTDGLFSNVISHPAIDRHGAVSFYADLESGGQGVLLIRDGQCMVLTDTSADTSGAFKSIGPLGPTMNDEETVAFRAETRSGDNGIFTGSPGAILTIADTTGPFSGFQGLPVITGRGGVVFLADLKEGGQGLYHSSGGSLATLADTYGRFRDFPRPPMIDDEGTVVFAATLKAGGAGIFALTEGHLATVVDTDSPFESFRSALFNRKGTLVFLATPKEGELGVFTGPDPAADRIIAVGDPLFDSMVAEIALNPVSINDVDQVAIRVLLANERQVILRADPA